MSLNSGSRIGAKSDEGGTTNDSVSFWGLKSTLKFSWVIRPKVPFKGEKMGRLFTASASVTERARVGRRPSRNVERSVDRIDV